jgi:RimJ/RimL family protein N-acetyltransferase
VNAAETPVVNIVGHLVALGPASRSQAPEFARWFSDFNTTRTQGPDPAPRTVEERAAWYASETSSESNSAFFSVYDRASWQHIGFAVLRRIDRRHGTATMAMMVGEPSFRGRGYGTEMARLMLDFGFTTLGLHNIMLACFEYNLAARHAYARAGFREIARWREVYRMGSKVWDVIIMDCLATEFQRPGVTTTVMPDKAKRTR